MKLLCFRGSGRFRCLILFQREGEPEGTALSHGTSDAEAGFVSQKDLLDDGQSQTGASGGTGPGADLDFPGGGIADDVQRYRAVCVLQESGVR